MDQTQVIKEEFEDTKVVIRIRISKKNRQHQWSKEKDKRTNNDLQKIRIKLKIELHELYYNPGNDPSYKQLRVVFSIKISKG